MTRVGSGEIASSPATVIFSQTPSVSVTPSHTLLSQRLADKKGVLRPQLVGLPHSALTTTHMHTHRQSVKISPFSNQREGG